MLCWAEFTVLCCILELPWSSGSQQTEAADMAMFKCVYKEKKTCTPTAQSKDVWSTGQNPIISVVAQLFVLLFLRIGKQRGILNATQQTNPTGKSRLKLYVHSSFAQPFPIHLIIGLKLEFAMLKSVQNTCFKILIRNKKQSAYMEILHRYSKYDRFRGRSVSTSGCGKPHRFSATVCGK